MNYLALFTGLLLLQNVGATEVLKLQDAKTKVEFLAIGTPSAIKIRGKAKNTASSVKGALQVSGKNVSGAIELLLNDLDTDIETRNEHMREKYLETQKFPKTELTITELILPMEIQVATLEAEKIPFKGELTLHGKKGNVAGISTIKKKQTNIEFAFEFKFPLKSFGIETPTFMGISVTDEVVVTAEASGKLVAL